MPTAKDKKGNTKLALVKPQTARRGQQAAVSTAARLNMAKALDLRLAGASYREIGTALGIDPSTAYDYIDRMLTEAAPLLEDVEKARQVELERLDKMQRSLWTRVLAGDHAADYLVLKVMDRRAKLMGLDAPERREVSGPGGTPIELSISSRDALAARVEEIAERKDQG